MLICTANDKFYIGISRRHIQTRLSEHARHSSNQVIHRAIRKYGWDAFEIAILDRVDSYDHHALRLEQFFIEKYDAMAKGYNRTIGGETSAGGGRPRGFKVSVTTKLKMRLAKLGTKQSPEHVERRASTTRGQTYKPRSISNATA